MSYNNQLHVVFYVIYVQVQTTGFKLSGGEYITYNQVSTMRSNGFKKIVEILKRIGEKKGGRQLSNERRKRCDVS